ncbi:polysaccharide deacetylase family protein [Phytoactinopolyspora halotolerans]|uniref:Polysaccharide deacetylase family protein n=1 Tax=Phytoactinopolyspora halotolerans TaxID=1981512 RepID=A0A6L9SB20_9ACTN|nr:polysaccharide deacetylase family protein [Phytoactinopolyspora halotolerans]NEE01751.1 polysaccharide deacetylase family protein [Phytoactinopolyspora halotolerans]
MRRTRRLLIAAIAAVTLGMAACSTGLLPGGPAGDGVVDGDGGTGGGGRAGVGKVIYLTFDDGPSRETVQILEVLSTYDAKAVFFAVGQNLAQQGDVARRIVAEGHVLANHTWNHADLTGLDDAGFDRELDETAALLARLGSHSTCVRPPYGSTDDGVERELVERGMHQVMWNVDTEDWTKPGVDHIVDRLLGVDSGDVILMHDGGTGRKQTAEALREALPELAERGYAFEVVPGC